MMIMIIIINNKGKQVMHNTIYLVQIWCKERNDRHYNGAAAVRLHPPN